MRGLRRSTQRARNKGKIAQGAAIQMNHFLLNVGMSEWRSSTEQGIRTMQRRFAARSPDRAPLGQKIEAVEGVVPAGVASSVGIADLPIFVLGCCELHSQEQAQLKVGAFQPQPSGYKN